MSEHVPAGMITFTVAIGRAYATWFPDRWVDAKPDEREFFEGVTECEGFRLLTHAGKNSIANAAYIRLREKLIEGALPAVVRTYLGAPQPIPATSWQSGSTDRLEELLKGRTRFVLASGVEAIGRPLMRSDNLDAVLRGEPVPSLDYIEQAPVASAPALTPKTAKGRRHKLGIDDLWIEACRMVHAGEQGAAGQSQIGFINALEDWSKLNQVSDPYKSDSIEKKIKKLWKALELG